MDSYSAFPWQLPGISAYKSVNWLIWLWQSPWEFQELSIEWNVENFKHIWAKTLNVWTKHLMIFQMYLIPTKVCLYGFLDDDVSTPYINYVSFTLADCTGIPV